MELSTPLSLHTSVSTAKMSGRRSGSGFSMNSDHREARIHEYGAWQRAGAVHRSMCGNGESGTDERVQRVGVGRVLRDGVVYIQNLQRAVFFKGRLEERQSVEETAQRLVRNAKNHQHQHQHHKHIGLLLHAACMRCCRGGTHMSAFSLITLPWNRSNISGAL